MISMKKDQMGGENLVMGNLVMGNLVLDNLLMWNLVLEYLVPENLVLEYHLLDIPPKIKKGAFRLPILSRVLNSD